MLPPADPSSMADLTCWDRIDQTSARYVRHRSVVIRVDPVLFRFSSRPVYRLA